MRKNWQQSPGDNDKSLYGSVLEAKNVLVMVPSEYLDHTNVSSPDSNGATQVPGINNDPINLVDDKPPSYNLSSHPPAFQYCPSAKRTLALNYASEISKKNPGHEEPVPVALN